VYAINASVITIATSRKLKLSIETILDNYDNDAIERKFVVLPFKIEQKKFGKTY